MVRASEAVGGGCRHAGYQGSMQWGVQNLLNPFYYYYHYYRYYYPSFFPSFSSSFVLGFARFRLFFRRQGVPFLLPVCFMYIIFLFSLVICFLDLGKRKRDRDVGKDSVIFYDSISPFTMVDFVQFGGGGVITDLSYRWFLPRPRANTQCDLRSCIDIG